MHQTKTIFYEDLHKVCKADFIPWESLKESTILITGATGLIGSALIRSLAYCNIKKKLNIRLIALVRNQSRANEKFKELLDNKQLTLLVGTVEKLPFIQEDIQYIIHGASQTASKEFIQHGVETIQTSVIGTMNLLNLAKEKQIKGFVYLSSMEVYGYPKKGHKVTENEAGALSPLDLRNSYPISKQLCEAMCCAYAAEYKVPAKIIRLTQTFGPEINDSDNRIFAYFAKCVSQKQNIILKTKGESERSYLRSIDAVTAILMVLLQGKNGQAYNAADEDTYCSIAEMAEKIAVNAGIQIKYNIENEAQNGFPPTLYMDLSTELLKKLGWKPENSENK